MASYNTTNVKVRFRLASDGSAQWAGWYLDDILIDEPCLAPTALTTTEITGNTANLGWTESGTATTWNIKYGAPGFNVATEGTLVSGVTDNPYTLVGLTANTTYDWYVQADCGGDESTWEGPASFTTTQVPATLPFAEDFESWPNSWTVVNGAQVNQWHIGTATAYEGGTQSAYISNDGGTTNAYTYTSTSEVHLYRDIAFTDGSQKFDLSFWWKGMGEYIASDRMRVYLVETSVTPIAGTELSAAAQIGLANYNIQHNWIEAEIEITGENSGTTKRLVFSWKNNHIYGTQPPIAIDNITITATPMLLDWYNLQGPEIAEIPQNENVTIYAQCWKSGVTEPDGPGAGIEAWIGYSTINATEVADFADGWTWIPATYNFDADDPDFDNDEYMADLGAAQSLAPGSYYYVSRFRYLSGSFTYGGYNGGPWDGETNVSGVLTVNPYTVTSFPWHEDFEGSVPGWSVYDIDGGGTIWGLSTSYNHTPEGSKSAKHGYTDPGMQDGYFISPQIILPEAGNFVLNFWSYNYFPEDYYKNSVLISTASGNPVDGNFVEVWTTASVDFSWVQSTVDLSTFAGESIFIAFRYEGNNAHDWYVDDILIDEPCPAPTALTTTAITGNTANLGWAESGTATTWNIKYGAPGFDVATEGTHVSGVTDNPYTLVGLTANTTYDWYVQAVCGGDESTWVGPNTFTTLPGAHPFPLAEDFESGFTNFANAAGNTVDWVMNTDIFHGGLQAAHNAYGASNVNILHETGILDLSGTTAATLEFWHIAKTERGYDKCYVEISTDGGISYNALPAGSYQGAAEWYAAAGYFDENDYAAWGTEEVPDNTWWKKEIFSLASYNTANVKVRFRLASDGSVERAGWYLDDILIDEPACPAPTALAETNITTTSADLGWTENGTATTWNIKYGTPGFDVETEGTLVPGVTNNPYTLEGLVVSTTYDWYVQAVCGGDESTWVGPKTFSTACEPTSIPYFENFDGVTAPAFPSCMVVENTNSDGEVWETYAGTYLSSPNSAKIGYNSVIDMDDWFFTEGLQLIAGKTYAVSFAYAAASSYYPENLEVDWGTDALSTAMSGTPIFQRAGIDGGWYAGNGSFTPESTGVYYIGFHGYSVADMFNLYVDDVSVLEVVETATWTGNIDTDWHTAGNWDTSIPTLGTDVTIPAGLTNYPTLSSAGQCNDILIGSSAAGTASLLDGGFLTVNGEATIQRHINGGGYHFVSVPINGTLTAGLFMHSYLYQFDATGQAWAWVGEDPEIAITNNQGYMIWFTGANTTYDFEGDLITGAFTAATPSSGAEQYQYNLVPNPYPSALDWDAVTGWTKTNLNDALYLWNRTATDGDNPNGQYASYIAGASTNSGSRYIPVGQAFFVETDGNGAPVLAINNDARVHSDQAFFKSKE